MPGTTLRVVVRRGKQEDAVRYLDEVFASLRLATHAVIPVSATELDVTWTVLPDDDAEVTDAIIETLIETNSNVVTIA